VKFVLHQLQQSSKTFAHQLHQQNVGVAVEHGMEIHSCSWEKAINGLQMIVND